MRIVRLFIVTYQIAVVAAAAGCGGKPHTEQLATTIDSQAAVTKPPKLAADSGSSASVPAKPGGSVDRPAADSSKDDAEQAQGHAGHSGEAAPAASAGGAESAGRQPEPAADSGGAYTFLQCANTPPHADRASSNYPTCDGEIKCGGEAHCIPLDRLKMNLRETLIERTPDCTGGKCVPDAIARAGSIQFNTCMGDLGEGRCIPQCFALWVEPLSAIFERGAFGCGREDVCAPCTHPTTGAPSSACSSDMCGSGPAM